MTPNDFYKCELAARLTLDSFRMRNMVATIEVRTFVPEGAGMGSSTSGVVASIRAISKGFAAYRGSRALLARHLQADAAEHACDCLMFAQAARFFRPTKWQGCPPV